MSQELQAGMCWLHFVLLTGLGHGSTTEHSSFPARLFPLAVLAHAAPEVLAGLGPLRTTSTLASLKGTLAHTTYFHLSNIKTLPGPDWSPGSSFVDTRCGMASQDQGGGLPYMSFRPWGDPISVLLLFYG